MKKTILIIFMILSILAYSEDNNKIFKVIVSEFRNDKGIAILTIMRKEDNPRKGFITKKEKIINGKCKFEIENIKDGEYAIRILHDENSNNEFDFGLFGMEGIGFSNNIKFRGKPNFDEIKIIINKENMVTSINMQYP